MGYVGELREQRRMGVGSLLGGRGQKKGPMRSVPPEGALSPPCNAHGAPVPGPRLLPRGPCPGPPGHTRSRTHTCSTGAHRRTCQPTAPLRPGCPSSACPRRQRPGVRSPSVPGPVPDADPGAPEEEPKRQREGSHRPVGSREAGSPAELGHLWALSASGPGCGVGRWPRPPRPPESKEHRCGRLRPHRLGRLPGQGRLLAGPLPGTSRGDAAPTTGAGSPPPAAPSGDQASREAR